MKKLDASETVRINRIKKQRAISKARSAIICNEMERQHVSARKLVHDNVIPERMRRDLCKKLIEGRADIRYIENIYDYLKIDQARLYWALKQPENTSLYYKKSCVAQAVYREACAGLIVEKCSAIVDNNDFFSPSTVREQAARLGDLILQNHNRLAALTLKQHTS